MNIYDETVEEIRKFNRFYTVNMNFLSNSYLNTKYSVAETRILFELYINKKCTQGKIVKTLHIDKSYLNRIIKKFIANGFVDKTSSETDKRTSIIFLTAEGIKETENLIKTTNSQITKQIATLSENECKELKNILERVISLLGKEE